MYSCRHVYADSTSMPHESQQRKVCVCLCVHTSRWTLTGLSCNEKPGQWFGCRFHEIHTFADPRLSRQTEKGMNILQ